MLLLPRRQADSAMRCVASLLLAATLLLLSVRPKEALDLKELFHGWERRLCGHGDCQGRGIYSRGTRSVARSIANDTRLKRSLACRRVYSSEQSDNGSVSSPGYPRPYPPETRCVYEFEGRPTQRVQLDFSDFSLYHPIENPDDCDDVDALVAYARAGDRVHEIDRFCGANTPRPIMSSGPLLTLEFRGTHASSHARGFLATYSFLENFGITSGQQLSEHPCSFAFNSSAARSGMFASPNFPGLYPRDTECHFLFFGAPRERVHLRFTYFDVEGVRPCGEPSASDYVEFSNFYGPDRKYERKCGQLKSFEVESDRKFFRVTFRSNDRLDGTGFNASYQFMDEEENYAVQKVLRDSRSGSMPQGSLTPLLLIALWAPRL